MCGMIFPTYLLLGLKIDVFYIYNWENFRNKLVQIMKRYKFAFVQKVE